MVHFSTSFCAACLLGTVSVPMWLSSGYSSDVGADFGPLEKLLKAQQWAAAAEETQNVVFQVSEKNNYPTIGQDMLTAAGVENFPCKDIKSLDLLWRKYSQDRLGYRSQLSVVRRRSVPLSYEKLREVPQVWSQLREQLGWDGEQEGRKLMEMSEGSLPLAVRSTADFGDAAVVRGEEAMFGMGFLARSRQCGVE